VAETEQPAIVLFDAECVQCSANAQFVLKHDRARRFKLASMQGEVGAGLFRKFGLDPADPTSIIVVTGETAQVDSDAVLAIYAGLGWPWKALAAFRVVPHLLRDPAYRWIARNRYRIFGKREACWVPPPDYADRVL